MEITYKGIKVTLTEEQEKFISEQLKLKDQQPKKEIFKIKLYHISGYELLRDGTKVDICNSLKNFFETFFEYCDYDENKKTYDTLVELIDTNELTEFELFEQLEKIWNNRFDGGGSGWFETTKNNLNENTFTNEFKIFVKHNF